MDRRVRDITLALRTLGEQEQLVGRVVADHLLRSGLEPPISDDDVAFGRELAESLADQPWDRIVDTIEQSASNVLPEYQALGRHVAADAVDVLIDHTHALLYFTRRAASEAPNALERVDALIARLRPRADG